MIHQIISNDVWRTVKSRSGSWKCFVYLELVPNCHPHICRCSLKHESPISLLFPLRYASGWHLAVWSRMSHSENRHYWLYLKRPLVPGQHQPAMPCSVVGPGCMSSLAGIQHNSLSGSKNLNRIMYFMTEVQWLTLTESQVTQHQQEDCNSSHDVLVTVSASKCEIREER